MLLPANSLFYMQKNMPVIWQKKSFFYEKFFLQGDKNRLEKQLAAGSHPPKRDGHIVFDRKMQAEPAACPVTPLSLPLCSTARR